MSEDDLPIEFSAEQENSFLNYLRNDLGITPSIFHPEHGPSLDYEGAAKALGQKNHHTIAVWRSSNRRPELKFFTVGRRAFCTVRSIMDSIARQDRKGS